jgi:drug/metabolite transporter (DMT)-like permease
MSRKTPLLFAATSVIWGSSFLFIRVAVAHLPPSVVVFGRTVPGAAFLVPLAARSRAFRGLRPVIVPIAVVTLVDMAAPAFLTAWGEQHIGSSAAGILTATDPLFTAVLALSLVRSEAPGRRQFAGLIIGFASVIALLGVDFNTGVAYWLFYLLIDQAGAATASVITYVMPAVALFLGVGLLGERLTTGAIAGLLLIGLGAWLATSRQSRSPVAARHARSSRPEPRQPTSAPDATLYRGLDGEPPDKADACRAGGRRKYP